MMEMYRQPAEPGTYDPRALKVAQAVHNRLKPHLVILFGSRARGDYGTDSDIDLLVVTETPMSGDKYAEARRTGFRAIHEIYADDWVGLDVITLPREHYIRCRGGQNHVAGQATRDGVTMEGYRFRHEQYRSPHKFDWEDVKQRVITCNRNLQDLENVVAIPSASQELIGFLAQQALENILKAWVSALGGSYRNLHDLGKLSALIHDFPSESNTDALEKWDWLTKYAVEYRYEGAAVVIEDRHDLYAAIDTAIEAIENRIKELTGVDELPVYQPPATRL